MTFVRLLCCVVVLCMCHSAPLWLPKFILGPSEKKGAKTSVLEYQATKSDVFLYAERPQNTQSRGLFLTRSSLGMERKAHDIKFTVTEFGCLQMTRTCRPCYDDNIISFLAMKMPVSKFRLKPSIIV
jgi:hypothetical protein